MAFAIQKFELVVSFVDNQGAAVSRSYEVPEGVVADYDEFIAIVPAMITVLTNVTDALISGYNTNVRYVNDTIVLPVSGIENENQAIFSGKIVGDPFDSATLTIPAPKPGIFVATSGGGAKTVNMGNAAVIALVGQFDGAPGWTISDGEAWVTATVTGKRRHSKNSNG